MSSLRNQAIRLAHANPGPIQDAILPLLIQKTAGADEFMAYGDDPNIDKAFKEQIQEAQYEHGNRGYTGTIAEKDAYRIRSRTPMTMRDARRFADKDSGMDKWGPAFALPIAKVKVLAEKKYTVKVRAANIQGAQGLAMELIEAKGRTRKGARVQVVNVSVEKGRGGGKAKVGFIKDEDTWFLAGATRAGAKKDVLVSVKHALETENYPVGTRIEVRQVKRLGYIEKQGEAASLPTWSVTGTRQQIALGDVEGWLFYGEASF